MASWNEANHPRVSRQGRKGNGTVWGPAHLLTTVGARTGEERTTPVMYHRDGERYVVVASKSGAPDNPRWYNNLKKNPVAKVEVGTTNGTETFKVRAREAEGEERARLYAERVAIAPGYGEYPRMTTRQIPVMILERIG